MAPVFIDTLSAPFTKISLISFIYFVMGIIVFYWSYDGAKDRGTLINIGE